MGTRGGSPNLPPAKVVAPAPSAISGRGGIFLGNFRRALFGPKIFRKPLLLSVSRQTAAVLSLLYLLPDAAGVICFWISLVRFTFGRLFVYLCRGAAITALDCNG